MINVIINPGTGQVAGRPTLRAAWKAARALAREARAEPPRRLKTKDYGEGRYAFRIAGQEVQMPGVSVETLKREDMFAPRLYVDGSSWYWPFALQCLQGTR